MKIHNFEQRSDEWFAIRKGKMTCSNAQAIGNCGKGLETYIVDLMAEYFSTGDDEESYTNADIQRGVDLEPQAREIYELENDCKVDEVGFIELDEFVGGSPDGLVGEDGGVEIKCLKNRKHFELLLTGEKGIESKYVWQIQMNLFITGRKWWDFIAFNPNYKESLIVFRITPDEVKQKKLEEGIEIGKMKIKEIKSKF